MFHLFRKKHFFTAEEQRRIVDAIKSAEQTTSGEVRVFVEHRCKYVNALDRAVEIFEGLKMYETELRNAVLIYVAIKDRQLAIFGDEGIHQKVGDEFWNHAVKKMIANFNKENYAEGIAQCVKDVGEVLHNYFPYDASIDKNELPDDIVFGK